MQLVILVGKQYKQCLHNFICLQTLEMRFFKNIVLVSLSVLLIWWAFALPRWTSFWKTQNPIALPPTQIISWGTVSGDYVSWWTVIADLGTNASGWVIIDNLYNSSGVEYTAWATPGLRTGDWTTLYPVQTWETRLKIWEWAISSSSYSMAIGNYTQSNSDFSTALWYDTKANWLGSLAIWYSTISNWTFSTAMGISTTAGGSFSTAMGNSSVAGWDYSIAGGNTASAVGVSSVALGNNVQANWNFSIAMWDYAKADWTGSYAFGNSAWALWEGSFAIWRQADADGRHAYSVWFYSQANQEDSYVFGNQSLSNGFGAMVFWQYAKANNVFSTAIWHKSEANADYSISAGNNTITNSVSSMAIWKYNVWNYDSVFEVGFGTNTGRANLFEVKNNWNIYVSKLTGYTCLATDADGMVIEVDCAVSWSLVETDPVWMAASGDYYTSNPLGYITGGQVPAETDPVWSAASGNYCPKTIYTGLTNRYIPYRGGNRFFNSNIMFYTNTHIWTYSAWDTAKLNIRNSSTTFSKWLNITMLSWGLYNGIWIDVKASKPIVTTTQNIWDPFNTTNIENNSEDNWWYFMTNYVSDIWWFSSAISKWGIVGVANGASFSTSSPAWFYIMNWDSSLASTNGSWRIVMSWSNLSIQIRSGWVWIEKWHFTP